MAKLIEIQPVLPSKNVSKAIEYYMNRLGFRLVFQDRDPDPMYAGVGRDAIELHLQWHDPKEWQAVERPQLRIVVQDVVGLFEEYRGQGVFHAGTALRKTAWGTEEFAFYDPDGNGLVFYRDLNPNPA